MDETRRIEKITGSLFILATVSSSLGFILLDSVLDDTDVLGSVAANDTRVVVAALFLLVNAAAVVVIPALLFPVFNRHNGHLARLYPGARIIESAVLVIGVVGLLSLVTLSNEYEQGSPDADSYRIAGDALVAIYDWGALLGIMFFFALAGLLLNFLLLRYDLVPRWLAVWGLVGVALLLIEGALEAFDVDSFAIMSLPFAIQEMVFAFWLIAKGLTTSDPLPQPISEEV
ncbi:MAG: DUF4386 domain-containing protein [Actinomycetia bacterium]|nr:DUF4386 domain-containing protein [Actinomycetes bacterium]MCP4963054.1 DUF4386 domain-containing protein [Actinomycetes bacterium]